VALRRGQPRRSALLFAAAARLRETIQAAVEPAEAPRRAAVMAALDAQLGAVMESTMAEGRALTRQQAIALALQHDQDA